MKVAVLLLLLVWVPPPAHAADLNCNGVPLTSEHSLDLNDLACLSAVMAGFPDSSDGFYDYATFGCQYPLYLSNDPDGDGLGSESLIVVDSETGAELVVLLLCDSCPGVWDPQQQDVDRDGVGDACDLCPVDPDGLVGDADSDGFGDSCDLCPDDPDPEQIDADGDGHGDACDLCPTVPDPLPSDLDEDLLGDVCDLCPNDPVPEVQDADEDGVGDRCDRCPDLADPAQSDADGDGLGDVCDPCPAVPGNPALDLDQDGVGDACDTCPAQSDPGQEDHDGDGEGDLCDACPDDPTQADQDGDGIADVCDICVATPDPSQADQDDDGVGDACDDCTRLADSSQQDTDGDGIGDACDLCPALADRTQADTDGDGFGDACDLCPTLPDEDQKDADGDGLGDVCDAGTIWRGGAGWSCDLGARAPAGGIAAILGLLLLTRRSRAWAALLGGVAACSDQEISEAPPIALAPAVPVLEIVGLARADPWGPEASADLPDLSVGEGPRLDAATVLLRNEGEAPLLWLQVASSSPHLVVSDPPDLPLELGSGEEIGVELELATQGRGIWTGRLGATSSFEGQAELGLTLTWRGVAGALELSPTTLVFPPSVGVGGSTLAEITLHNAGEEDLDLLSPTLSGSLSFQVEGDAPGTLAAGASTSLTLRHTPQAEGQETGLFTLQAVHGDPAEAAVLLNATTLHAAPEINLDLPVLDWGATGLSCSALRELTIQNVGTAPLHLISWEILFGSPQFQVAPSTPTELAPGASFLLLLTLSPDVVYPQGLLRLSSDDSDEFSLDVPLLGLGVDQPVASETFVQPDGAGPDVLFVIDNSCSMGPRQAELGNHAEIFLDALAAEQVDWQVGVVSTDLADLGCLQGPTPVVTPVHADPVGALRADVELGIWGDPNEMGMQSAWLAFTGSCVAPGGPNEGFLRPDSALHLIFVSDEADQSLDNFQSAAEYLADFRSLKASPSLVVVSSVTGGEDGCSGPGGIAFPGDGYVELTAATGGVAASICDGTWSSDLATLGALAGTAPSAFPLAEAPDPATIVVLVDGVDPGSVWVWDAWMGAIAFDAENVPPPGSTVIVNYEPLDGCP